LAGWLQQRKACTLLLIAQALQQRDVAGVLLSIKLNWAQAVVAHRATTACA